MVDKETHFSSFFMLLLSGTSLIVILSMFFSGQVGFRTQAKEVKTQNEIINQYPVWDDEDYIDEMVVEEVSETPTANPEEDNENLNFELETSEDDASLNLETDY